MPRFSENAEPWSRWCSESCVFTFHVGSPSVTWKSCNLLFQAETPRDRCLWGGWCPAGFLVSHVKMSGQIQKPFGP